MSVRPRVFTFARLFRWTARQDFNFALSKTESLKTLTIWKRTEEEDVQVLHLLLNFSSSLTLPLRFFSLTECPSLGSLPFMNLGFTMCSSCIWDDWAEMAGAVGRKGEFGWMGPIHSPHFHAHQDRVASNPGYEIFSVVCSVYARNVCCLRKQRSLNELPLFKCTRW